MRIDDLNLNRTPATQTQGTEKSDQAAGKGGAQDTNGIASGADQAEVSQLAQALSTHSLDRVEQLRMQVESGAYEVPAAALASSIIDAHFKD